jgi:flavin-dependent dehydrogenase
MSADTDFVGVGGPNSYSWNIVRSEADEMMLRHAQKSGAQVFEGVKVNSVEFAQVNGTNGTSDSQSAHSTPGRPVSASYNRKEDGLTGVIKFDYIVDSSGRTGLLSTKYLKNRHYSDGLKNVANWGYWKGTGKYSPGTERENVPYFEALRGKL